MRLVKCKKCGTPVMTDSTIIENMYSAMLECNESARKERVASKRNVFIQQASQIRKLITQVQHRNTQLEERKTTTNCEMAEITNYIRKNNLITDDKLDDLRNIAREKAEIRNAEDEKIIEKFYGVFKNEFANRTKKDPTSSKALGNSR